MERWRGDAQLYKELIRHRRIEMLTGVQDLLRSRSLTPPGWRAPTTVSSAWWLGAHDVVVRGKATARVDQQLAFYLNQGVVKAVVIGGQHHGIKRGEAGR